MSSTLSSRTLFFWVKATVKMNSSILMDSLIIIITAPYSNSNFTLFLDYWNSEARAKITSNKMIESVCLPHYLLPLKNLSIHFDAKNMWKDDFFCRSMTPWACSGNFNTHFINSINIMKAASNWTNGIKHESIWN